MSLYAALDKGGRPEMGPQVATNSGWSDFTAWARTLTDVPALLQVADEGVSDDLAALTIDLTAALERGEPTPDQKSIGDGLLAVLREREDAEVLVITNGETDMPEDDEPYEPA